MKVWQRKNRVITMNAGMDVYTDGLRFNAISLVARIITMAASSVNYGVSAPANAYTEAALQGACPIVGNFGGKDRNLRGASQKLDQALKTLGVDHDVKE